MIWIYKCNARHPSSRGHGHAYGDWSDFFLNDSADRWGSTQWIPTITQAGRGDTILAYQTNRNELVGVARVVGLRRRGPWVDLILKPVKRIGVKVRPLWKLEPRLRAIPAFRPGPIQTLYKIDRTATQRLLRAARLQLHRHTQRARARALDPSDGGGFGSPESNRPVELAAVRHVEKHFRQRGWIVKDVSDRKRGYDLLCTRAGVRRHVEVKGISGVKCQFPITAGEKNRWKRDGRFVLAVVSGARRSRPTLDLFRGPETLKTFEFRPLSFMAIGRGARPL